MQCEYIPRALGYSRKNPSQTGDMGGGHGKKQTEISESIKKEVNFLGVIKKKLYGFSIGLRFLGISRGESLFSKDKVTNI